MHHGFVQRCTRGWLWSPLMHESQRWTTLTRHIRYGVLWWALSTPHRILVIGLNWEWSHHVSICKSHVLSFKSQHWSWDAEVTRGQSDVCVCACQLTLHFPRSSNWPHISYTLGYWTYLPMSITNEILSTLCPWSSTMQLIISWWI